MAGRGTWGFARLGEPLCLPFARRRSERQWGEWVCTAPSPLGSCLGLCFGLARPLTFAAHPREHPVWGGESMATVRDRALPRCWSICACVGFTVARCLAEGRLGFSRFNDPERCSNARAMLQNVIRCTNKVA